MDILAIITGMFTILVFFLIKRMKPKPVPKKETDSLEDYYMDMATPPVNYAHVGYDAAMIDIENFSVNASTERIQLQLDMLRKNDFLHEEQTLLELELEYRKSEGVINE
jgi:hypothetical protein